MCNNQLNHHSISAGKSFVPLERFFGSQRQREGVHDNLNVSEFMKTHRLFRLVNGLVAPKKENCRDGEHDCNKENVFQPLPKCCHCTHNRPLGL